MTSKEIFLELILFCLQRLQSPQRRGLNVLRQILFEAEYAHYLLYNRVPFTGYRCDITSGLPTPHDYDLIMDQFEDNGTVIHYLLNRSRSLITPQREPLNIWKDSQIRVANLAIDNNTGSHTFDLVGWETIREGDPIPYSVVRFA